MRYILLYTYQTFNQVGKIMTPEQLQKFKDEITKRYEHDHSRIQSPKTKSVQYRLGRMNMAVQILTLIEEIESEESGKS